MQSLLAGNQVCPDATTHWSMQHKVACMVAQSALVPFCLQQIWQVNLSAYNRANLTALSAVRGASHH